MTEDKEEKPEIHKKEERYDFLKRAEELATRNENAVEEMRKLVDRNEELAARNLLGGRSDAGIQPVQPKEETAAEYTKRILSGK
jgi:hypothetical protein